MSDAEVLLRRLLDTIAKEQNYEEHDIKLTPIQADGSNYTSILYFITLSAPNKSDLQLFAKVANVNEKIRARIGADNLYKTERLFYTKLAKIYEKLLDKYDVPKEEKFVVPKFYGCNADAGEEIVVLENLAAKGFTSYNRLELLDWENASKCMTVLAKFHSLSFAYEKEDPEGFQDTLNQLKAEDEENDDMSKDIWAKMMNRVLQVTKDEYRERLVNFLKTAKELFKKCHMPIGKAVLVHGDYRVSNLLSKKLDTQLETIPVDYQLVRAGCPVTDIIYCVFMASDQDFRRRYWDKLLTYYFTELSCALKRLDIDITDVYPREVFDQECKEMLPYGLLISVIIMPLITVDAEKAPTMGGKAELSELLVKPSKLFVERFTGIIEDCVEWGII